MTSAFFIPGFSPDRTFTDSSLDTLKHEMAIKNVSLIGIANGWGEHGIQSFGQCAVEQSSTTNYGGILIAHPLGAIAALSVVHSMPLRHLVLCSPSALFSEDITANVSPTASQRIGEKRVHELMSISAVRAAALVSELAIPTTILFGEQERELFPHLVARSQQLAAEITNAKLVEIPGATHFIGENPYAHELAQTVSGIATDLK